MDLTCALLASTLPTTGDRYKTSRVIYEPTTWTEFPLPDGIVVSSPDDLALNTDDATFDAETHIIEARWDITENLRMNYIYGRFETEETIVSNWTAEEPMLFGTDRPAEYEQQSHELRFTYDAGGALKLVAGVYDWQSEYDIRLRTGLPLLSRASFWTFPSTRIRRPTRERRSLRQITPSMTAGP